MQQYVMKRLLLVVPTLLLISIIVFSLTRLHPGRRGGVDVRGESLRQGSRRPARQARARPPDIHAVFFLGRTGGDRGTSGSRCGRSGRCSRRSRAGSRSALKLGGMAITVALCLALPIGVLAAIRQDTLKDYAARSVAIVGLSVPAFWKATLVIVLPSIWFGWAPPLQFTAVPENPWQHLSQFILPAIILGIAPGAGIMRLTRALMLEVLRQDYIRTAWSKGMREPRVVVKHALKNAVIPVVTIVGIQIAEIAGGTVIMETIFGLPGMGRFLVDAIFQRDYPVVQGVNLLTCVDHRGGQSARRHDVRPSRPTDSLSVSGAPHSREGRALYV